MKSKRLKRAVSSLVLFLLVLISHAKSNAGDVYWHIDPSVNSCSMVIDPSLTQAQWHTFTRQAGAMVTFKSLAPAQTLGKMNFRVAIDYASSPVDQHDPAWINTFTHPDENCPLGDAIIIPTIRASMGVSDNIDIGGYWTAAPGANYGIVGGEFKYAFLSESEKSPAAAVRASVSILTGVPDFNMNIYSVDLMTSKKLAKFAPYVGLRQSLVIGTETTSKVNLNQERQTITQGFAGVAYTIWKLNLAAEYNISNVNTFAFVMGYNL
jgi:hypothetical protein